METFTWTMVLLFFKHSLYRTSGLQHFYRRLLRRRRQEVLLVFLFLAAIVLFQLAAPSLFSRPYSGDEDGDEERRRRPVVTLSHQEAQWEVVILQEEVRKLNAQITGLKKEIGDLSREPEEIQKPWRKEGRSDKERELINGISYQTIDQHGLYAASDMLDRDTALPAGGLRGAIIEEFNSIGVYICKEYNINPKGGIFRKVLRGKSEPDNLTVGHFQTGIHRYVPQTGLDYQLFFRDPSPEDTTGHYLYKIHVQRPFEQQPYYSVEHINSVAKAINIVVPLMGRLEIFQSFLLNLVQLKASTNFNLHLTVAYFGDDSGTQKMVALIDNAKKLGFRNINLIKMPAGQFSRGLGCQRGVEKWPHGNDVMFMCDVDLIINRHFLERCLIHTNPGRSIYYPVVFSQYNPDVVSFFRNTTITETGEEEKYDLSPQVGYWRRAGYGMLCTHRADFFKVGGYQEWRQKGADREWGDEDVDLYRRFVQHPKLTVIRAPDPGVIHKWHPKDCPAGMSPEKLKQCHSSMVVTEGSYEQLGLLHFKIVYQDFIKANKTMSLKSQPHR